MADVTRSSLAYALGQTRWERYTRANQAGGMGFRFETGILTVAAMADRVRVTADRLILYSGAHSHNPPGSEFDIGTPATTADGLSLDVPIAVTALPPVVEVVEPLAATVADRTALDATVLDLTHLTVLVED